MKFIAAVLLVLASIASWSFAQDYNSLLSGFGPYLQRNAALRDPRSNTGPVLFPPGPAPNQDDTSGVIVGASGYGFVPPNSGVFTYYY